MCDFFCRGLVCLFVCLFSVGFRLSPLCLLCFPLFCWNLVLAAYVLLCIIRWFGQKDCSRWNHTWEYRYTTNGALLASTGPKWFGEPPTQNSISRVALKADDGAVGLMCGSVAKFFYWFTSVDFMLLAPTFPSFYRASLLYLQIWFFVPHAPSS